jgi:hypothetical protein
MSTVTPSNDFVQVMPEVQSSRILSPPQRTEFEVRSMEEQQRRLRFFTDTTNEEKQQEQERQLFINLSLVSLFNNLSSTIISIINELVAITKETQLNDIIYIFIKDDRLVYIGLLFVIIAIAIYLIDVTS